MNLVDEQDGVRLTAEPFEHLLHALLEVAAIARARDERPEIERVHLGALQHVWNVAGMNPQCQAFGQRSLADAGLAHQQRIVLAAPAEDLDHPRELDTAADERIDLPRRRARDEISGVRVQRIHGRGHSGLRVNTRLRGRRVALPAMGNDPQQRETIDSLTPQEVRRMTLLLLEHKDQETARVDMLGARYRRVDDRLLYHAIQAERRLGLGRAGRRHGRKRLGQHLVHLPPQHVEVHAAHRQHLPSVGFVGDGPEQVLERHRVMTAFGREVEGALDRLERLRRERNMRIRHYWFTFSVSGSIVTSKGNSCSSASCWVAFIFVSATSCVKIPATPVPDRWTLIMIANASPCGFWKIASSTQTTNSCVV